MLAALTLIELTLLTRLILSVGITNSHTRSWD
jgi:hypothetical protein